MLVFLLHGVHRPARRLPDLSPRCMDAWLYGTLPAPLSPHPMRRAFHAIARSARSPGAPAMRLALPPSGYGPGMGGPSEDPTTEELRIAQSEREAAARRAAERAESEAETAEQARRAQKSAYLREKLEEREEAERRSE